MYVKIVFMHVRIFATSQDCLNLYDQLYSKTVFPKLEI